MIFASAKRSLSVPTPPECGAALALLMEEVGEVARAVNDQEGDSRIKEELLHVITVCIRWIENDLSI